MEDSKKRSRHLVGSSEASPARDFRLALFVFARVVCVSCVCCVCVGLVACVLGSSACIVFCMLWCMSYGILCYFALFVCRWSGVVIMVFVLVYVFVLVCLFVLAVLCLCCACVVLVLVFVFVFVFVVVFWWGGFLCLCLCW